MVRAQQIIEQSRIVFLLLICEKTSLGLFIFTSTLTFDVFLRLMAPFATDR